MSKKLEKNDVDPQERRKIWRCVECDSSSFHFEDHLMEISCCKCGLVLVAPSSPDFVTDGFNVVYVKKNKG